MDGFCVWKFRFYRGEVLVTGFRRILLDYRITKIEGKGDVQSFPVPKDRRSFFPSKLCTLFFFQPEVFFLAKALRERLSRVSYIRINLLLGFSKRLST